MNNPFLGSGCPRHPGIQRHQMPGMQRPQIPGMQRHQMPGMQRPQIPGMQRPQIPGMQRHQMPGMQRPQMGQTGAQQMSSAEALRLSGLDTGDVASIKEWQVVMIQAERQGLVERIGRELYLIGPEFWQTLSEEFGRPVGPGGGGGQDPFGQDGFDEGQGGFPSPSPMSRPY